MTNIDPPRRCCPCGIPESLSQAPSRTVSHPFRVVVQMITEVHPCYFLVALPDALPSLVAVASTAVVSSELLKLIACLVILAFEYRGRLPQTLWNEIIVNWRMTAKVTTITSRLACAIKPSRGAPVVWHGFCHHPVEGRLCRQVGVPALIYMVQNNLLFLGDGSSIPLPQQAPPTTTHLSILPSPPHF